MYSLNTQLDGRYATDVELQPVEHYLDSYTLRLNTYRKIQVLEVHIIQQVHARLRQVDPEILVYDNRDASAICERDMLYVLRYSAIALLINGTDLLEERVLLWLQTIMRSFKDHQHRSDLTYRILQEVIQQYLLPSEAALFLPILELNRQFLGMN
ncbi:phycobilisome protein [Leptothermofonsia sp. ETS-13]|uniref:phycobilisome protein n=1 Tax=Leptothermofonsia sp. ETS-13 TaxID=3035696 RepID=UPI003B9F7CDB